MTLSSAIEILTVRVDEMISLPIHHRIRLHSTFKGQPIYSDNYSDQELVTRTGQVLVEMLASFKEYFQIHFSLVTDINLNSYEADIRNAVGYLFILPIEFRMFLLEKRTTEQVVVSIIERHQSLINITIDILNQALSITEIEAALMLVGVSHDVYLYWTSALSPVFRDHVSSVLDSMLSL